MAYRTLEVKINSALLRSKKRSMNYTKVWIRKHGSSRTEIKKAASTDLAGQRTLYSWEEGFVFAIPECFLEDGVVNFEIYRTRKLLPDKLVGQAKCNMTSLFEKNNTQSVKIDEDAIIYDTSDDDESEEEEEDPRYLNMFRNPDSERKPCLKMLKEFEKIVSKQTAGEKRATSAKVDIVKGSNVKGMLTLDIIVWENPIKFIGAYDAQWCMTGIRYDEFMMANSRANNNNDNTLRNNNMETRTSFRGNRHGFLCLGAVPTGNDLLISSSRIKLLYDSFLRFTRK